MSAQTQKKNTYKPSLNLPKTPFSMKANLVQNEPLSQRRWQEKLYQQIRRSRKDGPRFIFHDGPPYANGSIHLGHLLNKVLKDMVVRAKTMAGFDCPFVPGWDCHGLPIEHRVMQELGDKAKDMAPMQIRKRCHDYASKFVKVQRTQMLRLLTLADYEDPYLTMSAAYEAATLEVFAALVAKGVVFRDLKPVHWSIANRTALADAELEYEERQDTSVYVLLEIVDGSKLPASCAAPAGDPVHLMIWTTTPWTLPANLAVAVHPKYDYGLYAVEHEGKQCYTLLACALAPKVLRARGLEPREPIGAARGEQLLRLNYQHPFIDRIGPVVAADYVTLDDGTGLVHTAPGHGAEDYQTGLRENLKIYCPVREDGTFDDTVPTWLRGADVWKANDLVVEHLRSHGQLFFDHQFSHSYPHDWRSKTPVIFRATEQWFVGVDRPLNGSGKTLRQLALAAAERDIKFIPEWGQNRMRGMLESRPDWCLSRQRAWGLPIPAFFGDGSHYLLTAASVRAVAAKVAEQGSDCWFKLTPGDLLGAYDPSADPDAPDWIRNDPSSIARLRTSHDIFDVWFESGSSWHAVIRQRFGEADYPTDLYLEGSDQHRGWFQLSLLPGLGVTGSAPYRSVLTHGFMVDKHGHKMSKSLGNTIDVEDLMKQFGADVCRWWVASLNVDNDIKVDMEFFRIAGEEYRKVRNTIRFLLGNLVDYDHANHGYDLTDADATTLDAWALSELSDLITRVCSSFDQLKFRGAGESIFHFCNETMSAVYLAALKDRLYCDPVDSPRRRRCQSVMYHIVDSLMRLLAPIMPHTADEGWLALHPDLDSVHLELLPAAPANFADTRWPAVMAARDQWLKAIEEARQQCGIDNPLDCGLAVVTPAEQLAGFDPVDLADLCGISRFKQIEGKTHKVLDLRREPRCERSWKRDGTVKPRSDGGMLSDRDAQALGVHYIA